MGLVRASSAAGSVLPAAVVSWSPPATAFGDPGVHGVRGPPGEVGLTPGRAGRCCPAWPELANGCSSHDSFQIGKFGDVDRQIALRFLDLDSAARRALLLFQLSGNKEQVLIFLRC